MAEQTDNARTQRVLVLAPAGRDAEMLVVQLRRGRFTAEVCTDVDALCSEISAGVGTVLVAEEALRGPRLQCLADALRRQPPWSDVPVVVVAAQGETTVGAHAILAAFRCGGNITLVERPIRLMTLFTVVDAALKARQRQYEVRNLLEESDRAVRQRDQFLAMLGHELRNPLAAIVTAVGILTRFGRADPGGVTEQASVISRQSAHMARLVDDLLDVARITAGKIELRRRLVDAREVVDAALRTVRLAAAGSLRHELTSDAPGEPILVEADPVRVEQVLVNLLTNAVKYTPPGGSVRLTVATAGDQAVLTVTDTGEGIPRHLLPRVFDPFVQVSQSLDRSKGGLGMGLAVVKGLVEMHGGSVSVQSPGPGLGSAFEVRLPLAAAGAATKVIEKGDGLGVQVSCDILLVEDSEDSRLVMARLLRLMGHRVDTAEDGNAGVEKALKNRPEVVLMDIGLPGIDGYEAARRIRAAMEGSVYLVAMTGYGQSDDRERVQRAGFDRHLVKPVDPDRLQEVLLSTSCGRNVGPSPVSR